MKQHLILRMDSCVPLHFLSAAVRYLGSMEACASCSSRPQTSLVIGWREKDSRCVRLTTFATKRGVWDMDHHRGLNLIGGDKTLGSKPVPTSHLCGHVSTITFGLVLTPTIMNLINLLCGCSDGGSGPPSSAVEPLRDVRAGVCAPRSHEPHQHGLLHPEQTGAVQLL